MPRACGAGAFVVGAFVVGAFDVGAFDVGAFDLTAPRFAVPTKKAAPEHRFFCELPRNRESPIEP